MNKIDHQQGSSLLTVIVAAALTGLIALITMQMLDNHNAASKALTNDMEMADLKKWVDGRLDCQQTKTKWTGLAISGATCPDTVPLYDKNGNLIVSDSDAAPSRVGRWTLRALCRGPGSGDPVGEYGLEIEAARVRPGVASALHSQTATDFYPDPLRKDGQGHGIPLDWWSVNTRTKNGYSRASSLFQKFTRPCAELFTATAPSAAPLFGGFYYRWTATRPPAPPTPLFSKCHTPNQMTGTCSCDTANGFVPQTMYSFGSLADATGHCPFYHWPAWGALWVGDICGAEGIMCVK